MPLAPTPPAGFFIHCFLASLLAIHVKERQRIRRCFWLLRRSFSHGSSGHEDSQPFPPFLSSLPMFAYAVPVLQLCIRVHLIEEAHYVAEGSAGADHGPAGLQLQGQAN